MRDGVYVDPLSSVSGVQAWGKISMSCWTVRSLTSPIISMIVQRHLVQLLQEMKESSVPSLRQHMLSSTEAYSIRAGLVEDFLIQVLDNERMTL